MFFEWTQNTQEKRSVLNVQFMTNSRLDLLLLLIFRRFFITACTDLNYNMILKWTVIFKAHNDQQNK